MEEKTVTMMEGVAREWRVRVKDLAGNVLNPEGFSFYGAAADGVQVPRRMQVHVEGDVAVLRLPGLWMSGRCWRYQVLCQDVLTGVEWVLCQGDVVLERRVACNGPALHEDAVLVDAVMDSEMEQVDVYLGDSTTATAEAARQAVAARAGADEAAARVAADAARVEELKRVTLDVAAGAALDAERAEDSKRGAEAAAGDAAADAQVAEGKAAEAEVSRVAAEAAQRQAEAKAAEAEASAKVTAEARDEAVLAMGDTEKAKADAEAAKMEAQTAESNAKASETQAAADKAAAERAKTDAQAAQSTAEEQAEIATKAAADAQSPASIAAQAARPATMCMLKDELLALLGDASLFDLDTDGQKIVVHTDRLDGEQLAAVADMLGRYVPQFIEVVRYNHHIEVSWRDINKYAHCKTIADMEAVNPDYKNDLTSDGIWVYPIPSMRDASELFLRASNFNNFDIDISHMTAMNGAMQYCKLDTDTLKIETEQQLILYSTFAYPEQGAKKIIFNAPNVRYLWSAFRNFRDLREVNGDLSKIPTMMHAFAKPYGAPQHVMHFNSELSSMANGENLFSNCALSKDSIIRICNSLKEVSNVSLVFGCHKDYKNDEEVLAAIANAESKGWTMSVQWNGIAGEAEPTAAQASETYSLRTPPIYARVKELEMPDGTTDKYLDWGHYVTDWEARGYEQFRSVEAAREYFGLPEEDLTENK